MADQNDTLLSVLAGHPDSPALHVEALDRTFSRGEVLALASKFANVLRAAGVKAGDIVTVVEPNQIEYIVAFLGVTFARGVAAPLNQNYREDEFKYYIEDAKSTLLVVGKKGNPNAEANGLVPTIGVEVVVPSGGVPELSLRLVNGSFALPSSEDALASVPTALEDPPRPSDEALFLHTSGTTSRPKGVPLTHANLTASLANIQLTYQLTPSDVSLLVMPLFHVHGLMAGLLAPLRAGASVILPAAGRFSAATFWQDALKHRATFYTAVPTMHQILLLRAEQDYPAANPPPLRFIRSCSSSLAPATLEKLETTFKAPVLEAYAMTEASHQMTSNPLPAADGTPLRRPGSVGKAHGSVRVTILDDAGNELEPESIGEVSIRGPNVTAGYRDNPKANADSFTNGWFRTGDQGKLSADGFLTLTGRIKELINRGGEKISPLEVDATLLAHPKVAEACSFGAPSEKYGEIVDAAVVLSPAAQEEVEGDEAAAEAIKQDIRAFVSKRLAAFKVPEVVFLTKELPKGPTGKIQRRFMAGAFIPEAQDVSSSPASPPPHGLSLLPKDAYYAIAGSLAALGVKEAYGVIGIPVTALASALQAAGVRFISCRNEQAAGYAAAAAGFLTGVPGVLLTVSGPGVVHALAGLSDAQVNAWPLLLLSGACEAGERGKGAFQELDQLEAVRPFVKAAARLESAAAVGPQLAELLRVAGEGKPGAVYYDLPSNVLMQPAEPAQEQAVLQTVAAAAALAPSVSLALERPRAAVRDAAQLAAVAKLLAGASKPLVVLGKGTAIARAEDELRALAAFLNAPVLATSMARGVVSDLSPLSANAARSLVLKEADVVLVVGARLNWQLHFGEAPKWGSSPRFVLVDPEPTERDVEVAEASGGLALRADAKVGAAQLLAAFGQKAEGVPVGTVADDAVAYPEASRAAQAEWLAAVQAKAASARERLSAKLAKTAYPLNYLTTFRVIKNALAALPVEPIVVSEGANTMDNARLLLEPVTAPRTRLDAGTWGTMGVGPGYAIAAATVQSDRWVVSCEGDSAFGFSGFEIETIIRYNLKVVVIIFNNGGIYGGDRREQILQQAAAKGLKAAGHASDPAPTAFAPKSDYRALALAFGGNAERVDSAEALGAALEAAFARDGPTLLDVVIDPQAGVESGNVHSFNFKKD